MSDERPDSLAAQAAAWVPPWERASRAPDPAYAAEQRALAEAEAEAEADVEAEADFDAADLNAAAADSDAADSDAADSSAADSSAADSDAAAADSDAATDDFGEATGESAAASPVASASPVAQVSPDREPSSEVPDELPPVPGEGDGPVIVDTPLEIDGEPELAPTDVGVGPEVPVPGAIEEAAGREDTPSTVVDAPLPPDGDDAGDVFDQAADDDVSDDGEVDLPFAEEVPGPESDEESGAAGEDEPATQAGPAPEEAASEQVAAEEAAPEEIDFAGIVAETDAQDLLTAQGGEEVEVTPEAAKPSSGVPAQSRRRKKAEPAVAGGALEARTEEGVEGVDLKPLDDQEMRAALEAIMLVVDEPVAEMQLAQVLEQPTERVAAMLEDISARYTAAGHGFDLRRVAGGWRLYTRPEYAPYVERFVLDGQSVRLTQAALETLAVVAYKQPVTRSRISAIRGVNCDGVMRTLVTRGLIEECGTESETGAHLYRTTGLFLEKLGLNSVGQLPPLAPFLPDDVEEVLDASG